MVKLMSRGEGNTRVGIRSRGFTLVELIVVIAIIAILVLLALPKLQGYVERAHLRRIQHDVKVMETIMEDEIVRNLFDNYKDFEYNNKKLGALILANKLFEKEGHARFVQYFVPTITREVAGIMDTMGLWDTIDNDELGIGGPYAPMNEGGGIASIEDISLEYKVIPDEYKTKAGTRLKGTFYVNENAKVYYEPDKPIARKNQEIPLGCLANTPEPDYEFEHETGKIVKYHGNAQHLVIPAEFLVNGECWPVRIIGTGAFMKGNFKSIVIPSTVTIIEEDAFYDNDLVEVRIPGSVQEIGSGAFDGNNLESIIYEGKEEQVVYTGGTGGTGGTYTNKDGGTITVSYEVPTPSQVGVIFIPNTSSGGGGSTGGTGGTIVRGSVGGCGCGSSGGGTGSNYGGSVYIPPYIKVGDEEYPVTEIAEGAYQGLGLISVILPYTLEIIEDYAFAGNQLIGVTIPNSVYHIGHYAFAFNEVTKIGNIPGPKIKPTIKSVIIKDIEQFSKINHHGDICDDGAKLDTIPGGDNKGPNINLMNHIFVTSIGNIVIDEEYIIDTNNSNLDGDEIQIAGGGYHTLVLTSNGDVYAWGRNDHGQLGLGDTTNRKVPTKITSLSNIKSIAADYYHSLALSTTGDTVYAWGYNGYGQLGDGDTTDRYVPTKIEGLSNIKSIAAGGFHSLALSDTGDTVYAWGYNAHGQLGLGDTTNRKVPTKITSLSNIKSIAAGYYHSLALSDTGDTVYAWGLNGDGQLGLGDTTNRKVPTKITSLSNIKSIAAGGFHSLALSDTGDTVYAWGYNNEGQLGLGDTADRHVPTKITSLSNIKSIAAGDRHSLALSDTGDTVYAWGYNNYGQLGNGTSGSNESTPVKVKVGEQKDAGDILTNIKSIAAGYAHSLALSDTGDTVYAWGLNDYGQLGNNSTTSSNTPVQVHGSTNN